MGIDVSVRVDISVLIYGYGDILVYGELITRSRKVLHHSLVHFSLCQDT